MEISRALKKKKRSDSSIKDQLLSSYTAPVAKLLREVEVLGEHGDHTRDLLLLVELWVVALRHEVPGHLVVHPGEDLQEVQAFPVLIQGGTQGLHEPGAAFCAPPRVIAFNRTRRRASQLPWWRPSHFPF